LNTLGEGSAQGYPFGRVSAREYKFGGALAPLLFCGNIWL